MVAFWRASSGFARQRVQVRQGAGVLRQGDDGLGFGIALDGLRDAPSRRQHRSQPCVSQVLSGKGRNGVAIGALGLVQLADFEIHRAEIRQAPGFVFRIGGAHFHCVDQLAIAPSASPLTNL